jgi:hypothetical protein
MAYSMAVAPEFPSQKRIKDAFMGPAPDFSGRSPWTPIVRSRGYEPVNAKQ